MIPNTPDPRTPTTALSSADQAPILAYLKAGKSDFFTLNEEVKGDDKVGHHMSLGSTISIE